MAIYDLYDQIEKRGLNDEATISHLQLLRASKGHRAHAQWEETAPPDAKNRFFTAFAARLFFFALLVVDGMWAVLSLVLCIASALVHLVTACQCRALARFLARRYLALKRGAISFIALIVALFSPALGTMVACSYFLMYDRKGVDEIVPSVLKDQFREFFPN